MMQRQIHFKQSLVATYWCKDVVDKIFI